MTDRGVARESADRVGRVRPAAVCWLLAALAAVWGTSCDASPEARAPWPPAKPAEALKAEPKTKIDRQIRTLIADYEGRIAALTHSDPIVRANLPRLRDNLLPLYKEYNRDKARYSKDCFTPAECIASLKQDMALYLDALEKGTDPATLIKGGQVRAKACWIDGPEIMGRYHCTVAAGYEPGKSWPIVISYQNGPEKAQRRKLPYFFISSVQKAYPKGWTMVEGKTRSFLKDVARDFNIDPFRVYATGFSFGGRTDQVIGWRFPHWFAAIAPVCSDLRDEQATLAKYLRNVPALLLHGTGDSFLAAGRKVHEHMKAAGCDVTFETYPGGHDPKRIFANPKRLTDYFDKHRSQPCPRLVSHVVEHPRYSRAFWVNAGLVKRGGAPATFEVRVKDGNRIEIDANEQIAELDLYLSDKLVDMSKPVTVVAGGKVLHRRRATGKLTVKLRDGEKYDRGEGDTLWRDILEIRKAAR